MTYEGVARSEAAEWRDRAEGAEHRLAELRKQHAALAKVCADMLTWYRPLGHGGHDAREMAVVSETKIVEWHRSYREATS